MHSKLEEKFSTSKNIQWFFLTFTKILLSLKFRLLIFHADHITAFKPCLYKRNHKLLEGKNLPMISTLSPWSVPIKGMSIESPSSCIEDRPSSFETEITKWNSMPIQIPSSNPDKNDHLYYYNNEKYSSTTSTNSCKGG